MKDKSIYLSWGILLTMALHWSALATPPYNPHKRETNYQEDYRPQFHFSPKTGWMNDINALVYHNGTYHMIYQYHTPRTGGYATSKDLVHWEDKGVALVPKDYTRPNGRNYIWKDAVPNVTGQCIYSGSGVLVKGEPAKKITGSTKPAIIAIYTGTTKGTCLAWSNDNGATWHDYPGNPVANPARKVAPRDPCVFWYPSSPKGSAVTSEPEGKWIMALYQAGTTFYSSKDLINWEKLSTIQPKFGYECPDVFELPLDGDENNRKWVVQDAEGFYLVGQFDGKEFHKEQEKILVMDKGPDFYAGQTFYRQSLPEDKVIQIAWNDRWNGGVGDRKKGWSRNATFPVELGLVTSEGLMQVTRNPIKAIEKLYSKTHAFSNTTLTPGKNILEGIKSKAFDLQIELDLNNCKAKKIEFVFADQVIPYKIPEEALVLTKVKGKRNATFEPTDMSVKKRKDGTLDIRFLIDWSNVEVFARGGVFSYCQHVAIDPKSSHVEIRVDGQVKVKSLKLHEIKSIWKK